MRSLQYSTRQTLLAETFALICISALSGCQSSLSAYQLSNLLPEKSVAVFILNIHNYYYLCKHVLTCFFNLACNSFAGFRPNLPARPGSGRFAGAGQQHRAVARFASHNGG
jgi:hypothetical protein